MHRTKASGRYRKIHTRIWGDAKFRALSDDAQLAFLFLITNPAMTSIGLLRGFPAGLAAEKGWEHLRFEATIEELVGAGMVAIDPAGLVAIPKFLRHNAPESPNVIKSWAKLLPDFPECQLLDQHLAEVAVAVEAMGEAFAKAFQEAFAEAFGKALPKGARKGMAKGIDNPEPEPEPEPDPEVVAEPPGVRRITCRILRPDSTPPPVQQVTVTTQPAPPGGNGSTTSSTSPGGGIAMVLRGGDTWHASPAYITELSHTFPAINVEGELRKAAQWLRDNPSRRKTKAGMRKYCSGWCNRAAKEQAQQGGSTAGVDDDWVRKALGDG